MNITRHGDHVHVTLTAEEAEAVRDDLGQIRASKVSAGGDQLHSLLESVTGDEAQPCPAALLPFGTAPADRCVVKGFTVHATPAAVETGE